MHGMNLLKYRLLFYLTLIHECCCYCDCRDVYLVTGTSLCCFNVGDFCCCGGLVAGLSLSDTVQAFNAGLGDGAEVALAYAVLGAFALALSKSDYQICWRIN